MDELYTTFTHLHPIKHRVGSKPGGIDLPLYPGETERERERLIAPLVHSPNERKRLIDR